MFSFLSSVVNHDGLKPLTMQTSYQNLSAVFGFFKSKLQ